MQFLVRESTLRPVDGRPDPLEQQQIAEGIGAMIRQLRHERHMGIRDLEKRSGVSRSTISRLEAGLRRPRRSTLGWLAWGLDYEHVTEIKAHLVAAAAHSLIAESRWSERTKQRRVYAVLARGGIPVPMELLAPYAVAALGAVIPDEVPRLQQVQQIARSGQVPWPESWGRSAEALAIATALMHASTRELATIGRAAVRVNDYAAAVERRTRDRKRRAREREEFLVSRQRRARRSSGLMEQEGVPSGRTTSQAPRRART